MQEEEDESSWSWSQSHVDYEPFMCIEIRNNKKLN
jgi:hypothetical protein